MTRKIALLLIMLMVFSAVGIPAAMAATETTVYTLDALNEEVTLAFGGSELYLAGRFFWIVCLSDCKCSDRNIVCVC